MDSAWGGRVCLFQNCWILIQHRIQSNFCPSAQALWWDDCRSYNIKKPLNYTNLSQLEILFPATLTQSYHPMRCELSSRDHNQDRLSSSLGDFQPQTWVILFWCYNTYLHGDSFLLWGYLLGGIVTFATIQPASLVNTVLPLSWHHKLSTGDGNLGASVLLLFRSMLGWTLLGGGFRLLRRQGGGAQHHSLGPLKTGHDWNVPAGSAR